MFVAWLFHDSEFNECFAGYLSQIESGTFQCRILEDVNELSENQFEFVFTSPAFLEQTRSLHEFANIILLGEPDTFHNDKYSVMNPYQNRVTLIDSINRYIKPNKMTSKAMSTENGLVYGIFSAAGGVGTTTFAIEYAKMLATASDRTLLILFEKLSTDKGANEYSFSTFLIDSLRAEAFLDQDCLDKILKCSTGYYVLPYTLSVKAEETISTQELSRSFSLLKTKFNHIVIDFRNVYSGYGYWFIKNADELILVEGRTEIAEKKNAQFIHELKEALIFGKQSKLRIFTSKPFELNKVSEQMGYLTSSKYAEEVRNWNQQAKLINFH